MIKNKKNVTIYVVLQTKENGGRTMFIFDISNPLTLILMLAATVLLIFLAQEIKKSYISAIVLFAYLIILIMHVAQIATLSEEFRYMISTLARCIAIDFVFVLISFFAYLWVDDIEAKETGKKSIDNSLDWFWRKV